MAETLLKDIRYALRWMARSPGFSAVAILSLGLGVGVNTAMFSLVDSLLFRPLPVSSPDTLVDVFTTGGDGDEYATSSYQDFLDLKSQNTVFTDMIGYSPMMAPLSLGDRSRIALGQVVTSNHFSMLGIQPFLGRLLVPSDDEPGAPRVVVLSHRMWQREFGSDPAIVGRSITLRGLPYTIAGVAPESFTGVVPLLTPELWLPIRARRRSRARRHHRFGAVADRHARGSSGAACDGCSSRAGSSPASPPRRRTPTSR